MTGPASPHSQPLSHTGREEKRRITLPNPHAGQRQVLEQARRFNVLVAGRRWMKTSFCSALCVEAALTGQRVIWGAPAYDQVRIAYDWIDRAAFRVVRGNQSRMEMRFAGGGSILFRSLDDPDNARGHTADLVVMDEAGDLAPSAWREVLRPMLITTQGKAWMLGTPRGRNWFYEEWQHGIDPAFPEFTSWQAPTVGCQLLDGRLMRIPHPLENPLIPFSEIEQSYLSLPERVFRQEYLAEFTEDSGGVFRNVRACSGGHAAPPLQGHRYVMGVDFARFADFTAICVLDLDERRQVALERFNNVSWEIQRARIEQIAKHYQIMSGFAEENAIGSPNIELLQQSGLPIQPFTTTQRSKDHIITGLAVALERGSLQLLSDPVQIAELEAYREERLPSGVFRYSAPEGQHDDTVIALALALAAADTPTASVSFADVPQPARAGTVPDAYADEVRAFLSVALTAGPTSPPTPLHEVEKGVPDALAA